MVKKDKEGLGRSLVKSRFGSNRNRRTVDNGTMLHTTAVQDGYEWARLNLQSVTEESSFQEFLSTAQLANTEFQAEKLNLKFVSIGGVEAVNSAEFRAKAHQKHIESKHLLRVPRRPPWTKEMTAEQLQENERQAFLDWRRDLALVQENEGLILTPYEKNLEFWRQLWRVLERSHVLIQVVDARNPLLFRCEDLEAYAKEVGVKACLLLLNKSDLLSEKQRSMWAEYFDQQGVKVAFFSASVAAEKNAALNKLQNDITEEDEDDDDDESDSDDESGSEDESIDKNEIKSRIENIEASVQAISEKVSAITDKMGDIGVRSENAPGKSCSDSDDLSNSKNSSILPQSSAAVEPSTSSSNDETPNVDDASNLWGERNKIELLDRDGLINLLRSVKIDVGGDRLTFGLVGYPNVGKSSTINALMDAKKVSVSATPGKTKHFQTLFLEDDLMLCDCPGLVLPSFVCTKAEMVVHGILPIDHMREYMDAISLVTESLGSRYQAERRLAILLPPPPPEKPDALPPRDVLNAYAYSRGMMTGMGTPDCARAARAVLRAATRGSLPLVIVPPGFDAAEYMSELYPPLPKAQNENQPRRQMTPQEALALKMEETSEDLDRRFFASSSNGFYSKGVPGKFHGVPTARKANALVMEDGQIVSKPWKQINKHMNKNKKQKLRKVYNHLDKH